MLDEFQPSPDQIKVLLVDDIRMNAELLAGILQSERYQTVVASSGQEALDKVATEKPDMSGFEVGQRIKSKPKTLFLPVILVTALSATEHRVRGAAAGADDFVSKPPDEQELLTRIKSLARVRFL